MEACIRHQLTSPNTTAHTVLPTLPHKLEVQEQLAEGLQYAVSRAPQNNLLGDPSCPDISCHSTLLLPATLVLWEILELLLCPSGPGCVWFSLVVIHCTQWMGRELLTSLLDHIRQYSWNASFCSIPYIDYHTKFMVPYLSLSQEGNCCN